MVTATHRGGPGCVTLTRRPVFKQEGTGPKHSLHQGLLSSILFNKSGSWPLLGTPFSTDGETEAGGERRPLLQITEQARGLASDPGSQPGRAPRDS